LALDANVYAMEEQPLMITVVIVLVHMQVIEQIGNYTSYTGTLETDLLLSGEKAIELRKWNTKFRGKFLIHASIIR
jgi:hypothetical protein